MTFTVHQISKLLYVSIYAKPFKEKAEAARRVVRHKVDEVEEIPDIFCCYFFFDMHFNVDMIEWRRKKVCSGGTQKACEIIRAFAEVFSIVRPEERS